MPALRCTAIVVCLLLARAAQAGSGDFDESIMSAPAGDALQIAIPLAALGLTFVLPAPPAAPQFAARDWLLLNGSPRHDLALALVRTEVATYALKFSVPETRPNGGAHSFPSGHTSFAFAGAEFIRKDYGWRWGAPAYLLAAYVGFTRVESGAHWNRDVLAGAALGALSNHELLSFDTRAGALAVALLLPPDGGGLQFFLALRP